MFVIILRHQVYEGTERSPHVQDRPLSWGHLPNQPPCEVPVRFPSKRAAMRKAARLEDLWASGPEPYMLRPGEYAPPTTQVMKESRAKRLFPEYFYM